MDDEDLVEAGPAVDERPPPQAQGALLARGDDVGVDPLVWPQQGVRRVLELDLEIR